MSRDPHDVRDRLLRFAASQASRHGAAQRQMGAAVLDPFERASIHALNPPLDDAVLDEFELAHGIVLPDDYRFVLTQVGNGGAGLFSFGHAEDHNWDDAGVTEHVGQPFPHSVAWNLDDQFWQSEPGAPEGMPQDEEDQLWEEWDRRLQKEYFDPALTCGAIPICDLGCGLGQWLVVHGPQRGYVWNDHRADHRGLSPALDLDGKPMTFISWCESWLEEAERMAEVPNDMPTAQLQLRVARRRELLTLLLLVVAGVLLGVALAYLRG